MIGSPGEYVRLITDAIELVKSEKSILDQIEFNASSFHTSNRARRNGNAVCELMKSLFARKAIPNHRVNFFTDASFNIGGRGLSRLAIFERNGTRGDDIFKHPHFLKYLWYFIYGARLPLIVKNNFFNEVRNCGCVTSGDIDTLQKLAKQQTRSLQFESREAAEEFFKLAVDCGLGADYARYIRNAVNQVR